ncbi:sodium-coupled monocarboxylate transporter 1 isoform X4 [Hypanus sabinus]|uniref:sodium-coupled monocarboxylate transporter 1 isoform X4 n=1 Tax=Hypanus sabinus TaxID=79690 RepID=UPI0028C4076D|nr:sodium-coupled monocarboxylate transporter 1 isoform X4 [Hypanus sabinus]
MLRIKTQSIGKLVRSWTVYGLQKRGYLSLSLCYSLKMSISGQPVAQFSAWDYVVFVAMLLVSLCIGVYHAFKARGQQSNSEFLLGGRKMKAVPVAMSLTASFMSAVTVIGTPAEVYRYGAIFLIFCISYTVVATVSAEIFLPVFYRLNITSTYEYLGMRFNKVARYIGTILYIILTILYTGIVIYAPALALNQITGFDLWGVLVATGLVCTFYCTLGGLKAVVWTDVFQMLIMIAGFLAVIIRGSVLQGGFGRIWNISYHGGRLNFWDFDPDPLRRHTFWTIVVGGSFMWTAIYGINQSQVQRYIACRSLCEAKMSLYLNMFGLWLTAVCAVLSGLVMYSTYYQCDPLTAKQVREPDQLLPYLVMDFLGDYPGVPGLFVASAYSGTLSTVSSSINALAAVTVEDILKPHLNLSEKKMAWITKGLSLMFGLICIGMAALSSLMGSVLQAALTIFGIIGGPLLGFFLLGMIFPWANSIGAISGLVVSLVLTLWVGIGGQVYPPLPEKTQPLPLSVEGCLFNITTSAPPMNESSWGTTHEPELDFRPEIANTWYSISYLYLSPLATMTVLILGLIISLLTGRGKREVNTKLLITKKDLVCCFCWTDAADHLEEKDIKMKTNNAEEKGQENPTFSHQEVNCPEKPDPTPSTTYL